MGVIWTKEQERLLLAVAKEMSQKIDVSEAEALEKVNIVINVNVESKPDLDSIAENIQKNLKRRGALQNG